MYAYGKTLFLLLLNMLCLNHCFAQDLMSELNSILQTDLKICIKDECYEVLDFEVIHMSGSKLDAKVRFMDLNSYEKEKEFVISTYSPYYIEDGIWRKINGEYEQSGDIRKIHFYHNREYGSMPFDFKSYRPDGVLGCHESLSGFYVVFSDYSTAKQFVSMAHKIQGDAYDSTPWLRTLNEMLDYREQSSKEIFESIAMIFNQYEIKSEQVYLNDEWAMTSNIIIRYKHPNIIISHTDKVKNEFAYGKDFKRGTITITFPIADSQFEFGRGFFGGIDKNVMCLYSHSGIEVLHNGKKGIVENYKFFASKLICKDLLTKLRVFKKKVIEENFHGRYGFTSSSSNSKQNSKSKLSHGKYEQ